MVTSVNTLNTDDKAMASTGADSAESLQNVVSMVLFLFYIYNKPIYVLLHSTLYTLLFFYLYLLLFPSSSSFSSPLLLLPG